MYILKKSDIEERVPLWEYKVGIHLGHSASSLVVDEQQQDSTVFSVGTGIVLVCALPYKVLTASRMIMAELAHPPSLSLGPCQWFCESTVTLEQYYYFRLIMGSIIKLFSLAFYWEKKIVFSCIIQLLQFMQKRREDLLCKNQDVIR